MGVKKVGSDDDDDAAKSVLASAHATYEAERHTAIPCVCKLRSK